MPYVFDASRIDQANATTLFDGIVPLFQPIYALREGRVVGFEALARLTHGGSLVRPARFLPLLEAEGLLQVFRAMLARSAAFLQALDPRGSLYVTVNVNAFLVQQDTFVDLVSFVLDEQGLQPSRLILEVMESEAIDSIDAMATSIRRLQAQGIRVALDDIGSGHAALINLRDLPVDMVKLDQSFSRRLASRPLDLHFIACMVGLARRLRRALVVEGAETPEVVDALRMVGVAHAQGYALGRPMPASAVPRWLATSDIHPATKGPCTLLGAYAAYLAQAETCHVLAGQPLPLRWHEGADDPHRCGVGRYFDSTGLHDTPLGRAHKRFHQRLGAGNGVEAAEEAATELGNAFLVALGAAVGGAGPADPVEDQAGGAPSGASETVGAVA